MLLLMMLLQVNLCSGRTVNKTKAYPIKPYVVDAETFAQVPVTTQPPLNRWMIDPTFATFFKRITDADLKAQRPDGEKRGFIVDMYSSMPAWSSDEKYMILYSGVDAHMLYSGDGSQRLRVLNITPNDIEHVYWSPRPEKVHTFYYPSSFSGERKLYKVDVGETTDAKTAIHDFKLPPTNCTSTSARGLRFATMYMSYDTREIVGMSCGDTCWLYSIGEDKIIGEPSTTCNTSQPSMNAPFPAPSGTRAYIATGPVRGISFSVPPAVQKLVNVDYGIKEEHRSIGRSAAGADIYTSVMFEAENPANGCQKSAQGCKPSATLIATDMGTGRWKVLIGQSTGWPGPYSTVHESMVSLFNPGWIVSSQVGAPDIMNPQPQGNNVLYAANYDTGVVCQLTHVRTWAGVREGNLHGYWSEPHPVESPTGKYIIWNSDWHNSPTVNVFLLDTQRHLTVAETAKLAQIKAP